MPEEYAKLYWYNDKEEYEKFINNLAPIVLFTYNRLEHTKKTIEALQQNVFAKESRLFIYSDAPKNEGAVNSVQSVREYLHSVTGFKEVIITERETNWGLAENIIDGVTKIVNKYGKIIVLEDDIVTSKYFLQYMNDALEVYKDEPKVMEISGYMYPVNKEGLPGLFFMHIAGCWGWATWKNCWIHFKREPEEVRNSFSKEEKRKFTLDSNWPDAWQQILSNCDGKLYTWFIFWYATIFKRDMFSMWPKQSLSKNIGMDGSGEHCGKCDDYASELFGERIICFPLKVEENNTAIEAMKKWNKELLKKQKKSLWYRAIRKIYVVFKEKFMLEK